MKFGSLTALLILCYGLLAQERTTPRLSAQRHFEEARNHLALDSYNTAIAHLDTAIYYSPALIEAFFLRAMAYDQQEDYEKALVDYLSITHLNPELTEAWFGLGLTHYRLGQFEKSKEALSKALKQPERETVAIYYRLSGKGEVENIDTQSTLKADIYNYLALNELALNNYSESLDHIELAIASVGTRPEFWINKGLVLKEFDNIPAAREAFENALRIEPDHALAKFNLRTLEKAENATEAQYNEFVEQYPNMPEAYSERGAYYLENELYEQAALDFRKALKLNDQDPVLWYNLGLSYDKLELYNKALGAFKRATSIDPAYFKAYMAKANSLSKLGSHEKAIEAYNEAEKWTSEANSSLHYNRGVAYHQLELLDKACADFKIAEKLGLDAARQAWDKVCQLD